MKQLTGVFVIVSSAVMVYFLHAVLRGEVIPIVLLFLTTLLVLIDYSRRYFYLVGLVLYPLITIISVAITRNQSLYPIVIFYELSMVAMALFGVFLGIKARGWMKSINIGS